MISAASRKERILILAPFAQDAPLAQSVLKQAGLQAEICSDILDLGRKFEEGAGTVVIAEEALIPAAIESLKEKMNAQPPWSDIPVILLTSRHGSPEKKSGEIYTALGMNVNVNLLERTFRPVTLISMVQAALRARRRQYEVRDLLVQLKNAQERYTLAVRGSSAGIWEWNPQKNESYFSPEWKALLGYEDHEIKNTREEWHKRLHPEDVSRVLDYANNLQPSEPGSAVCNYEIEYRLRHRDGSYRWFLSRGVGFFNRGGQVIRVAGSHIEISDRKQNEQALQKLAEELNRSNKELEQFAYIASHDLQEPLRIIQMYLDLLLLRYKDKLGSDAEEFIHYAQDGSRRSQKLIRDLLEYARIGNKPPEPAMFSFEYALERALSDLQLLIRESGAEITSDPLPSLTADGMQITQLFQNLISNAIKYRTEQKPRIHVSARKKAREWIFSIRDNGVGIEPQYRDRIFAIFQRLHKGMDGTGIGLAICKKIVERHGGRIWVESRRGDGSTFYFSLPCSSETESTVPAAENLIS